MKHDLLKRKLKVVFQIYLKITFYFEIEYRNAVLSRGTLIYRC
jgi:hypothetical protein